MDVHKKTDELLEELIYCDLRTDIGVDKARKSIRLALKKQDRDTRHSCAEEVVKGAFWNDAADSNVIRSDHAHDAVMNCQGGLVCRGEAIEATGSTRHTTHNKTINAIMDLVANELSVDREKVTYDSNFADDLGADSLDLVQLLMKFEEFFGCEVEDSDAEKMVTVKDVFDYCDRERLSIE